MSFVREEAPDEMPAKTTRKPPSERVREARRDEIEFILRHYAKDCFARRAVLRTSEVTLLLKRSVPNFSRSVPAILGKSLKAAIDEMRLAEATRLLVMARGLPVEEIWSRCGFGTRQTFFKVFKSAFGITPAKYRQQSQKG